MHRFLFNHNDKLPKVKQIVRAVILDIEKDVLQKGDRLPSINEFSQQYSIARDTVEKAYKELKLSGHIISVISKGYYVAGKQDNRIRVLLVFNKLSSYKKIIYDAILEALGDKARVDLQIHHYNPRLLKEIIEDNIGKYHYYVIMPHFFQDAKEKDYLGIFQKVPEHELIILDKNLPKLTGSYKAVYQDFKWDIYHALQSGADLLKKYDSITIIFPAHSNHPTEITEGVLQFCNEQQLNFSVLTTIPDEPLAKGSVYIVVNESDLALLIKKSRDLSLVPGKDLGIISFNETVLKELLDITVITTDFEGMGQTTADFILHKQSGQLKNPFRMIRRNSL